MNLQLRIDEETCIRCGACADDCPYAVLLQEDDNCPAVDPGKAEACIQCQHCLAVCPTGALSILGCDPDNSIALAGNLPSPEQMETLIKGRRSIRSYNPEPLPTTTIDHLLSVTANAPTGVNNRQVLFTLVEDQQAMVEMKKATIAGIRALADTGTLPARLSFFKGMVREWDKGRDIIFRNAPHLLIVSSPADGPSPAQDTLIALSYFELLAASMGIGTLWNGLATWAFTHLVPTMIEKLGIPASHSIGYTMSFGMPAVTYHRTVQRSDVHINRVHW